MSNQLNDIFRKRDYEKLQKRLFHAAVTNEFYVSRIGYQIRIASGSRSLAACKGKHSPRHKVKERNIKYPCQSNILHRFNIPQRPQGIIRVAKFAARPFQLITGSELCKLDLHGFWPDIDEQVCTTRFTYEAISREFGLYMQDAFTGTGVLEDECKHSKLSV